MLPYNCDTNNVWFGFIDGCYRITVILIMCGLDS